MLTVRHACASLALALTVALAATSVVLADPPAGKGKDKGAQSGSWEAQEGKEGKEGKEGGEGKKGKDGYDGDSNHGNVVSECNHRANERNLKGKDRKEWTEWCEERGSRNNYDYRRYSTDRNCYQKADDKGLSGDKRRKFINDCLDLPNKR